MDVTKLYPEDAKIVFRGKIFSIVQWTQKMYDGTYSTFERIIRPSTAMVIPIKSDGKIILSKQEQPGLKPFIGLVGGVVNLDENPENAAKRELLEESGYEAENWILWDQVQLSEKIEWTVYTYIAKNLKVKQNPTPDNGEKIETFEVTFEEFIQFTHNENFRDIEIALKIHRMENNKEKMMETKHLFSP